MKHCTLLGIAAVAVVFFTACGGNSDNSKNQMESTTQSGAAMESSTAKAMMSSDEWIRAQPVDVKALDTNQDGFVYQDQMDWNVIADQEGKCPKCEMVLKKVTVDEAIKNLKDHGFSVK